MRLSGGDRPFATPSRGNRLSHVAPDHMPAPPQRPSSHVPSLVPVILLTTLFGLLAAPAVARRARQADRIGAPAGGYWAAFAATFTLVWLAGSATFLAMTGLVTL